MSIKSEKAPEVSEEPAIAKQEASKQPKPTFKCGIIMPISEMGTYTEAHWLDVRRVISAAAQEAGFESDMVSTGADVGIIHANIINNIYQNEMVVCDVSGKNPNVMFELGLRLASKLPVIIIKDDSTTYSFDTSPIEHLEYRRDLRIYDTLDFQKRLAKKITGTYAASQRKEYKTFLDHFGNYTLAKVEDKAIDLGEFMRTIFARLDSIEQNQTASNRRQFAATRNPRIITDNSTVENIRKFIQPLVNEHIGKTLVHYPEQYTKVFDDVKDIVFERHGGEIIGLPLDSVEEGIRLAIRRHLTNRELNPKSPEGSNIN